MTETFFNGPTKPETPAPRAAAIVAHALGVTPAHVTGLLSIEAAGAAFDRRGRLKMLFEPHLFWRHLSGDARRQAEAAGLARSGWRRDYPPDSYPRLLAAMEIDREAALMSASWGAPQILGQHAALLGYGSAEAMVRAFATGRDEQLVALARFLIVNRLNRALGEDRWAAFARGYNGPAFAANRYDVRLREAVLRYRAAKLEPLPARNVPAPEAETVREVQAALITRGHTEVGAVDGVLGPRTRAGVALFRWRKGVGKPGDGIDNDLLRVLQSPETRKPEQETAVQITLPRLNGRKTYIVAATLLIVVVVERGLGIDVPGVNLGEDWLLTVLNALGLGALRHAISR